MQKIMIILLFMIVSITWGTTFMAMKIAVNTIPPLFITGVRFLLTSLLLIYICYYTNTSLFFPRGEKIFQIIVCIFYFIIPFSFMLYGGTYVNSIIASAIFANMPIMVLLFSFLFFDRKLCYMQHIGLMLAILFLSMILFQEIKLGNIKTINGIVVLVLAMMSHAIIYLYSQEKCSKISVLTFNALPSFFSGLFLLCISNIVEHPIFHNFSFASILATLYLSYVSGVFGILSYFYLQKQVSSFHASMVFFIFPFITLILEKLIYGNSLCIHQLKLLTFLMSSIFLTLVPFNYKKIRNYIKNIRRKL
ncbi:MAG: DMT family transporter [Buchnera aphidicola (Meitanaphis flavogallis)]